MIEEDAPGEVDVEVTTAVALSDDLRRRIAVTASRYAGRTARLVEKVDPDLLAVTGKWRRYAHELNLVAVRSGRRVAPSWRYLE